MIKQMLVVLFLLSGIAVGLFLVTRSQEFRERAGYEDRATFIVCHNADPANGVWENIEVTGEDVLDYYLSIGDKLGSCDGLNERELQATPTKPVVKVSPQGNPNSGGGVDVNFVIAYQSVNTKRANQRVIITLRSSLGGDQVFDDVLVEADQQGKYYGEISGVKPGSYTVYIKGQAHLQLKFEEVVIDTNGGVWDWSARPLIAGDFNADNLIDLADIAELLAFYEKSENYTSYDSALYDINFDGVVDATDVDIVTANFDQLEVSGEK